MKILAAALGFLLSAFALLSQEAAPETFSTIRQTITRRNGEKFTGYFFDYAKYKAAKVPGKMLDAKALPPAPASFDWAKGTTFPMLGNDQYGDCFYASICHHDQTMTGAWGPQSNFLLSAVISRYRILSGGDNGLSDGDVQGEWKNRYLADVPNAKIVDWLYINTTDPTALGAAMYWFGGTQFTFTVPSSWMNNSDTGDVWDSNNYQNNNNGHAVHFNGIDTIGNAKLQTWGTFVWITPKAIKVCNPDGFVVFSTRWFDAKGYAPNGKHVTELASIWASAGGKQIPAAVINQFPSIAPTPPPGPLPTPTSDYISITTSIGGKLVVTTYPIGGTGKTVPDKTPQELIDALNKIYGPPLQKEPVKEEPKKDEKKVGECFHISKKLADEITALGLDPQKITLECFTSRQLTPDETRVWTKLYGSKR